MKAAKVLLSALVILLFESTNAFCAGEVRQYQIRSTVAGEVGDNALSVYLPEGYDTSGASYPVLYLIHGLEGNNLTFLGGGYGGVMSDANVGVIVDRLVQEGRIKPLIVACPDVHSIGHKYEYLLHDILSFVDATFRTIPDRQSRAIGGHSWGGYDSLYMTLTHPEVFSLAGGFSSYNLDYLKANLRRLMKNPDLKLDPIQFWLYAGRRDEYGVTQLNRDFVKALKENALPVEYVEDDGDHASNVAQRLSDFIVYLSSLLKW